MFPHLNRSSPCPRRQSRVKSRPRPCRWWRLQAPAGIEPAAQCHARNKANATCRILDAGYIDWIDVMGHFVKRSAPALTSCLCGLVAVLALAGCDRRSESNPGSTPAAVGSGSTSGGRSDAGTPSSGVEVRTPAAPDIRSGGSSGSAGVAPVPDTSGAPSSGSTGSGSSDIRPGDVGAGVATGAAGGTAQQSGGGAASSAQTTTNGGVPASAMGGAGSTSGSTNSTPQSNTGGR